MTDELVIGKFPVPTGDSLTTLGATFDSVLGRTCCISSVTLKHYFFLMPAIEQILALVVCSVLVKTLISWPLIKGKEKGAVLGLGDNSMLSFIVFQWNRIVMKS